jgi:hypothetical protein
LFPGPSSWVAAVSGEPSARVIYAAFGQFTAPRRAALLTVGQTP